MSVAYELARCAVCGSADGRELATPDDVRAEVEALWAFHTRRLQPGTPPAHLMDRVAFSQHAPLRVVRCTTCGLVYRNPVERARELEASYEDESPTMERMRALHDTQRVAYAAQAARLTRVFGRRGVGIEVGSYVGAFLVSARDEGWRFSGVDVNACANQFTRALGFDVHDGPIESLDAGHRADVVAIWNCLDQLADPASAIRAARRHLAPGGRGRGSPRTTCSASPAGSGSRRGRWRGSSSAWTFASSAWWATCSSRSPTSGRGRGRPWRSGW